MRLCEPAHGNDHHQAEDTDFKPTALSLDDRACASNEQNQSPVARPVLSSCLHLREKVSKHAELSEVGRSWHIVEGVPFSLSLATLATPCV